MILFVNGWSDDNKGDAAIVLGTIAGLRQVGESASIGLVSMFRADDPGFAAHYRHTGRALGAPVFDPILPTVVAGSRARRRAVLALALVRSVLALALGPDRAARWLGWAFPAAQRRTLRAFATSRVVISKGGHILVSLGGVANLLSFYFNAFPLLLAQRAGVPSVIYGQSIGPIKGRPSQWLARILLRQCRAVLPREAASEALIRSLVGERPVPLIAGVIDPAFFTPPEPLPAEVELAMPMRFVALTVRQWEFPERRGSVSGGALYGHYLDAIGELARHVTRTYDLPVVLVDQVRGPTVLENDFRAWDDLRARRSVGTEILEVRADLTPGQLRTLYGRATATIGTRFHSVILSLAEGTPALAISYYGTKATGIMTDLGLGDYVVAIDGVDPAGLIVRFDQLMGSRDQVRATLAAGLDAGRSAALRTAAEVMRLAR